MHTQKDFARSKKFRRSGQRRTVLLFTGMCGLRSKHLVTKKLKPKKHNRQMEKESWGL